MPTNKRIGIIDVDGLLYATACTAEMCAKKQGTDGEDLWFQVRPLGECYEEVEGKIETLLDRIEADDAIVCLSDRRNFRYDVLPTYKGNRAATRRPPMMVHLREVLLERQPFRVLNIETLEADDVCGITSTALQRAGAREPIICSEDKDLLTIPGIIHRRGHTFENSLAEADRFWLYQTLVGDVVDGYKGLPGIGTKRATTILDSAEDQGVASLWRATLAAFITNGYTEEDALQQARVARILRTDDWDQSRKEVRLWQPSSI